MKVISKYAQATRVSVHEDITVINKQVGVINKLHENLHLTPGVLK